MLPRLLVASLLAGVAIAGCVQTDSGPGAAVSPPSGSGSALFKVVPIPGSSAVSEPSLAVDHKGAIYVSAPAGLPTGSALWKSTDGGATWKVLTPNPTPLGGGDTSLAIAPDDSIYVTDLWAGSATMSVSHDAGATWTSAPISSEVPYYDREWNTVDKAGHAYFLGRTFTPAVASWVSRSDDGGTTWVLAGNPWINPNVNGGDWQDGPLVANPRTGEVAVVYNCDGPAVCFSVSKDMGMTWTQKVAAKASGSVGNDFAGLAADSAGAWYVAYAEMLSGGGSAVKVVASKDDGATWSAPQVITTGAGTRVFPWIVAGDAGRIAVAWYETPTAGDPNDQTGMKSAKWNVLEAQSLDGGAHWQQARVTPQPIHTGTISTEGLVPNGPDRSLGDFFTMDVGPDGMVHLAFMGDAGSGPACLVASQLGGDSLYAPGHTAPTPASPTGLIPVTLPAP